MKALLITYHFPPMLGCCALRTGAVARALAAKGCECHILTAAIPRDHPVYTVDAQTKPSDPLWHLYPISDGRAGRFLQRLRQNRFRHKPSSAGSAELAHLPQSSRTTNLLRALAFPDSKVSWIPRAHGTVQSLLKHHRFDLIYSFGYPWSCHVVGWAAQRRSGTPWVADYADPWTLNPEVQAFPAWRKRLDFFVESRLLRRASAVVVATPESQAFLSIVFGPEVERRGYVARVAQFPPDEYDSSPKLLPQHFQIAFTGLFHATRQPYSFYEALEDFANRPDIRVCLAGLIDEHFKDYARKHGLEPLIHHLGRLGRQQTIELQMTSHILLSFGWPGGLQVPCKIYEYFAARRPLLHIAGDPQDPAAALVRKYRRGLVVPNNPQAIRDGLRTLYALWVAGKLEPQFDLSPLDEFCLPRSLDGLEQAFREVIPHVQQAAVLPGSNAVAAGLPS